MITLGNEALGVAAALVKGQLPQALTTDSSYGARHVVAFDDRKLEVLPLVHPGEKGPVWIETHERWIAKLVTLTSQVE